MTLAQQIQTLQSRGLIIADTNKAEQALDAISYSRKRYYEYHNGTRPLSPDVEQYVRQTLLDNGWGNRSAIID